MKYLCLAYGDEKDWNVMTKEEQAEMLAQDEVVRKSGSLMAAVQTTVTTVRAWDGKPTTTDGAFADSKAPLAGFSIIEAADLDEVVRLVWPYVTETASALGTSSYASLAIQAMTLRILQFRACPFWIERHFCLGVLSGHGECHALLCAVRDSQARELAISSRFTVEA